MFVTEPSLESEVVLESPTVLAQLLLGWPSSPSRRAARRAVQSQPEKMERPHPDRSRICTCGSCSRCRDNARWNRIFDEKFADPSYYGRMSIRHDSSLAGA
jgi:hypothetical protein